MIERQPILTDRLLLEPISTVHAEPLWEATRGSLETLERWMPWAQKASEANSREFTERSEADWDAGTDYAFAVLKDGRYLGGVGLHMDRLDGLGQIGYWIRTEQVRNGYATEAAGALLVLGFEKAGLYRLELRAGVDNKASQRVAEKLGFVKEGVLRKGCPLGPGKAYDCYLFGLLAQDWRTA